MKGMRNKKKIATRFRRLLNARESRKIEKGYFGRVCN